MITLEDKQTASLAAEIPKRLGIITVIERSGIDNRSLSIRTTLNERGEISAPSVFIVITKGDYYETTNYEQAKFLYEH